MPTTVAVNEAKARVLLKEQGELRSKDLLSALVQSWRNAAQALAQTYRNTRHLHPASAERCLVRSETYAECSIRLEETLKADNVSSEADAERPADGYSSWPIWR